MNSSSKIYHDRPLGDDEVQQLLDNYGGSSANWPSEYREALSRAIAGSSVLQKAQQTALQLDVLLDEHRVHETARSQPEQTAQLAAKIMRELPAQEPASAKKNFANQRPLFTLPDLRNWWPAPVFAAALVAIVVALLPSEQPVPNNIELAFEKWAWEDVTAQSVTPDNGTEIDEDMDILLGLWQDG